MHPRVFHYLIFILIVKRILLPLALISSRTAAAVFVGIRYGSHVVGRSGEKGPPCGCSNVALSPWIHRSGSQAVGLLPWIGGGGGQVIFIYLGANCPVLGDHLTSWDRKPECSNRALAIPCGMNSTCTCFCHKYGFIRYIRGLCLPVNSYNLATTFTRMPILCGKGVQPQCVERCRKASLGCLKLPKVESSPQILKGRVVAHFAQGYVAPRITKRHAVAHIADGLVICSHTTSPHCQRSIHPLALQMVSPSSALRRVNSSPPIPQRSQVVVHFSEGQAALSTCKRSYHCPLGGR